MKLEYAKGPSGAEVAYSTVGSGDQCIVYVPGLLYPIEVIDDDPPYARFVRGLSALGRTVVVERRGIGASDPVDWDADVFAQWSDDVICVMDAVGAASASIVGYASGARIALKVAMCHPDRVDAVVALHSGIVIGGHGRAERDSLRVGLAAAVAREGDVSDGLRNAGNPSRADDPGFRVWFERGGRLGAGPQVASAFWRVTLDDDEDFVAQLPTVATRALVLHRGEQVMIPPPASRALADLLPNGSYHELPGGDLSPNSGDVDGLLAAIGSFLTGEVRLPATDRRLHAIVFTDLVASTEQLSSIGDERWRAVLDHHDGVAERAVGRHGGTVVKSTGDGLLAVFDNGSRALAGAIDLREDLGALGLAVRIGVHVGEVEFRNDDVSGIAVHLAARVMATAATGEIRTSAAVPLVTAGGAVPLESVGRHPLRGFDGEFELFRVG